jgi:hypothetical protein
MINDNNKLLLNINTLQSQPNLTENKNYLDTSIDDSSFNDHQQTQSKNLTLRTILLHTRPGVFFVKSSQKENFIAIFSIRKKTKRPTQVKNSAYFLVS